MSLQDVEINEKIIKRIKKSIEKGNISHAYIFESDLNVNKKLIAENFVKAILCENKEFSSKGNSCNICSSCKKIEHGNYEDLIYINKEGNSIKDEVIEELQVEIKKKPYVGLRKVIIIQDADTMTVRAQNRLLKTLEEPALGTIIILLSENVENLTQTIRSRCIIFRLNPNGINKFESFFLIAKEIESMIIQGKTFYEISKVLEKEISSKEEAYLFLDALENWYRDIGIYEYDNYGELILNQDFLGEIEKKSKLYKKAQIYEAIDCIEEARNNLNRNINISYTLKKMILKIGG
ncbi:hypothetical protein [Anaerovorax odorimutans]|uniref:hypothetical protein n=1 Tax=Anaerovorax odorimutans TaxID=109327 RepID=UPI000406A3B3|nr:hypothetical protein [Anaerovorax odorimutans]